MVAQGGADEAGAGGQAGEGDGDIAVRIAGGLLGAQGGTIIGAKLHRLIGQWIAVGIGDAGAHRVLGAAVGLGVILGDDQVTGQNGRHDLTL